MTGDPRRWRATYWRFLASDPRSALTIPLVVVVFAVNPSWKTFWAGLLVLSLVLVVFAWWARNPD